jgi:formiminoglutamase
VGLDIPIYDAGDVVPASGDGEQALLQTHERVEAAVRELHRLGLSTICIGGGHDLSLASLSAVAAQRGVTLGGINLDAHLDVRQRVGSGMPFRRLIERGALDPHRFIELGVGRFANEEADLHWLTQLGARIVYAQEIQGCGLTLERELELALGGGCGFVSIDLDVLDQAVAPGVSAPNPLGLSLSHAVQLAEAAGKDSRVLHFDIMEFNPKYDRDSSTARAAALLLLHFVAGFRQRQT